MNRECTLPSSIQGGTGTCLIFPRNKNYIKGVDSCFENIGYDSFLKSHEDKNWEGIYKKVHRIL